MKTTPIIEVDGTRKGGETNKEGKYGYIAFYKNKKCEVYADSSYEAQQKAAKKLGAKKTYDVSVVLAEKDGEEITHTPLF